MILSLLRVLLPVAGWLGCCALCRELAARRRIEEEWRHTLVLGTCAWAALLTCITELVSLGHALNRPVLVTVWLLVDAALWSGWICSTKKRRGWLRTPFSVITGSWKAVDAWHWELRLMLLAVLLLVLFLGSVALLTPTTNWDSLTYHLPRMMHWIQNQSVEHYPTGCISQLQMGPWAAFLQTHLFLLWNGDRLANLVQWSAMAGSIIVVTLIARQLRPREAGRGLRIELFTALLTVTLPTGIVESITSQTDYVATFWLASFTSLVLSLWRDPDNLWYLGAAALACGLGALTKITFVIYVAPLGLAAGLWMICRWRKPSRIMARTLVFVSLAVSLILPHAFRNREVFGSPTSSRSTQQSGLNKHVSFNATLSNIIRNAALHTNTGITPLTRGLNDFLKAACSLTGRGVSDPDNTFPPEAFKFQNKFAVYDSETGNAYHLGLIVLAVIVSVCRWKQNRPVLAYTSLFAASYVLFCAVLRWQQWNSRYHLAYFVLLMPMAAVVLVSHVPRWLVSGTALGLISFAGVVVAINQSRPVFNPTYLAQSRFRKMLFEQGPLYCEKLETMAGDIVRSRCQNAGLKLNSDDAEYPLWVVLRNQGFTGRINHAQVDNESARLPVADPYPCLLITMSTAAPPATVREQFPFRMDYGVMSVFWSEQASHWHELIYFDFPTRTSRVLSRTEKELLFDRRVMHLYARTPRPGVLRVSGTVTSGSSQSLTNNTLRVATDEGWSQESQLVGGAISFEPPVPTGTTRIRLSLLEPVSPGGGAAKLDDVQWNFDPR